MYKEKPKTGQQLLRTLETFVAYGRAYAPAVRVVVSLATVVLALVAIVYLADWPQLKLAIVQLGNQPWLLAVLVVAYTGAFFLRAIAWRALSSGCIGLLQLFVSIQAGLLVNHLTPIKLGEIVRPLLAARYGMPVAEAASTTAVARYLDFSALLAIAAVVGTAVSLSTGSQLWLEGLALPAAVILGCGAILLATRQSRGFGCCRNFCGPGWSCSAANSDRFPAAALLSLSYGQFPAGSWRPLSSLSLPRLLGLRLRFLPPWQ